MAKKEAKKKKKNEKVVKKPKKAKVSIKRFSFKFKKFKLPKLTRRKAILFGTPILAFVAVSIWLFWGIPAPGNLSDQQAVSTKILDRNGKLIFEIYSDERRSPIGLDEIPDYVKNATIAIEDKNFYSHGGFDLLGLIRGLSKYFTEGRAEGGSTLTQQLVKNSLLTPERTIRRKAREFVLSILVELRYSKDEILELYLNQIPYGSTAYGIEAASELYFGKETKDLTLAEATLLAGLPQSPTRYSPFGAHPELAKGRQETVLRRMVEDGYVTQEEADNAKGEELHYAETKGLNAPHFALWVKELLAEKYGDRVTEQGGLRVTTTLDLDLQEFAQEVVKEEVGKLENYNVGNGAALVTRPETGEILAMVGSKDYFAEDEDGKVNIIFAERQPGSSIKPLNYALGIKEGSITAASVLADIPTCFSVLGQEIYCPVNYDGEFHGAVQARFALGNSFNIPAVRVLALNGIKEFTEFTNSMGITTYTDPSKYGLSLTLGGGEVKPYDMAVAYGVFANQGVKKPLIPILKVEDWHGKVLDEIKLDEVEGDRVLDQGTSYVISHILLDNNARSQAFGTSSYLNVRGHPEVSVKTGTTNDRRDNWTVGFSPKAVVVVWVGNNDNTAMSGAVSGVSGASPIWNRIMRETLDKTETGYFDEKDEGHAWPLQPSNIIGMNICANTGYPPNDATPDCPQRFEYFLEDHTPEGGAFRQDIPIDRVLQQQATNDTAPENIEMQNHLVITDPLNTIICLDCGFPMQEVTISYPLIKQ